MDEITEGRFDLVGDQIEHLCQRVEALEKAADERDDAKESSHARAINWAMLGLFVLEVVIGVAELWWMVRHA